MNGSALAGPGGAGSVETIDADLKASLPLIGGKIEKAAAPPIEEAIDIEAATVKEWLARWLTPAPSHAGVPRQHLAQWNEIHGSFLQISFLVACARPAGAAPRRAAGSDQPMCG